MGKRSRERRRAEERASGGWTVELVTGKLLVAASAAGVGDLRALDAAVGALDEPPESPRRQVVDAAATGILERTVSELWEAGWQPVDVHRHARRRLGAGHAVLLASAIAVEARRYHRDHLDPRWVAQLDSLDAFTPGATLGDTDWALGRTASRRDALIVVVATLAFLHRLPRLPLLLPPPARQTPSSAPRRTRPSTGGVGGDPRMLEKVRALLAKAESTTFEAEAAAFTAKAQELMTRYAIDRAMLADREDDAGRGPGAPGARRVAVEDPYAAPKGLLLSRIAQANRCRTVSSEELGFSTVFGFDDDLDAVELLFTSLLVQADTAMVAAGRQVDARGRSRTRSFRQSFLVAFAVRIGNRLSEAAQAGERQAGAVYGAGLLPVLACRAEAVDEAVNVAFPRLSRRSYAVSNRAGWAAGTLARRPGLAGSRPGGHRRVLTRARPTG